MSRAYAPVMASAPWRPSPTQVPLLTALIGEPERRQQRLAEWCRRFATQRPDPDVTGLLPFAAPQLLEIDSRAEVTRAAQLAYHENARLNLVRIGRVLAVLDRFAEAAIPVVLLKGAALVVRYYRNYGTRPMVDADLLVHPGDVARALSVLDGMGWAAAGNVSADLLPIRLRVQHALALEDRSGHSLDLHWRPLATPAGLTDATFWAGAEELNVSGTTVRVLGPTHQLFQICVHAVQPSWSPTPRWMMDVATILDADGPTRVDWDGLLELAVRTNTTARLRAAIADFEGVAGDRFPASVREALAVRASSWQGDELALFARMPPYAARHVIAWHWYLFQRLRDSDAAWRRRPALAGFADYVLMKLRVRRARRRA